MLMEEPRIKSHIEDFLKGFDDSIFPADFLKDYEAQECLGHSQWNETLLVRSRGTGAAAVAKCYDMRLIGGRGEGDLLRRLRHPALPAFIAEYKNDHMLCVVREYVEGAALSDAVKVSPLSREQVLDTGLQLCDILRYLHEQTPPVIHRDIKPENIILKENGRITLIDFGISRVFDKDARNDTVTLGTASFAPPEQYGFAQTDCRSDIFSLGMVLGFLLTRNTELDAMPGGIDDRALRRIVAKCTAFAPKDRYANVSALQRSLSAQLPVRRQRRRAAGGILGAALLCGIVLAFISITQSAGKSIPDDANHVPAFMTGEEITAQAADYLNQKYGTDSFQNSVQTADIGDIRDLLINVYGYDEAYANARPAAMPPVEVEDSFLPWAFEDSQTVPLDMMVYFAVKIYWPRVVRDWSGLKDDTGEYPGIRVARPFAEENGIYANVNRTDRITLGDVAVMLYNADRAYGDGLPPQLANRYQPEAKPISALGFTEPLMERAVRAVLGKSETDPVSAEELASVAELYVFGNTPSASQDGFYASASEWYSSGNQAKGNIASLEDVKLLPNLRILCLAAQQITDISPLASLPLLEKVEFKHNRIADISVLASLPALASAGLNGNPVSDTSPLGKCVNLRFLDLCDVKGYDPAFLGELGDFEFLDLANDTDSFAHLGNRRVRELKLGYSGLDSLDWISGVAGLASLEVKHSQLTSLKGIEAHQELTCLNIAGCSIQDLSPVLLLPNLQTLVISEDMRPAFLALGNVSFTASYE